MLLIALIEKKIFYPDPVFDFFQASHLIFVLNSLHEKTARFERCRVRQDAGDSGGQRTAWRVMIFVL